MNSEMSCARKCTCAVDLLGPRFACVEVEMDLSSDSVSSRLSFVRFFTFACVVVWFYQWLR